AFRIRPRFSSKGRAARARAPERGGFSGMSHSARARGLRVGRRLTALALLWVAAGQAGRPVAQARGPRPSVADVPASPAEVAVLAPTRFARTTGPKNAYHLTVTVPPWAVAPFRMHVQNGEPDGTHRVSSASVVVNGTEVLRPSDFNQNVA